MAVVYEQGRKDIDGAKLKTLLLLYSALDCNLDELINDEETKEMLRTGKFLLARIQTYCCLDFIGTWMRIYLFQIKMY